MPNYVAEVSLVFVVRATCENCHHEYVYDHPVDMGTIISKRHFWYASEEDALITGNEKADALEKTYESAIQRGKFANTNWYARYRGLGCKACPTCGYVQSWQLSVWKSQKVIQMGVKTSLAIALGAFVCFLLMWFLMENSTSALASALGGIAGIACLVLSCLSFPLLVAAIVGVVDNRLLGPILLPILVPLLSISVPHALDPNKSFAPSLQKYKPVIRDVRRTVLAVIPPSEDF